MTVIIPHKQTKQQAVDAIDHAVNELYKTSFGGVEIVNPAKVWNGATMTFSLTGRLGFIEVPLAGTAAVDDENVTVICELPVMLKNFIGEDKIRAGVEQQVKGYLGR